MTKRVRISNESVNSYGFRVLTSGMEVAQYQRNPVLLYMHQRGEVIGYMKDVQVKDGEVTGEPVFDEVTELSRRCKKQFEFGSLKMVSAGLDVYETTDAPDQLAKGQKRPTVTRCRLMEVSMVDIGSNDDAIVLSMGGKVVHLAEGGECPLPLLRQAASYELQATSDTTINPNKKESAMMTLKDVALMVGLQETATEAEVRDRIQLMLDNKKRLDEANAELARLAKARTEALVDRGIAERRIDAAKREEMVTLFGKLSAQEAEQMLANMTPQLKPSALIHEGAAAGTTLAAATAGTATAEGWKTLRDVPADHLAKLKAERPEEYKRLYKAEYGMDCPAWAMAKEGNY